MSKSSYCLLCIPILLNHGAFFSKVCQRILILRNAPLETVFWCSTRVQPFVIWMSWLHWTHFSCLKIFFFLPWELNFHETFSTMLAFLAFIRMSSSLIIIGMVVLDTSKYYLELEKMNTQIGQVVYPKSHCYFVSFSSVNTRAASVNIFPISFLRPFRASWLKMLLSILEQSGSDSVPLCKLRESDVHCWEIVDPTEELWEDVFVGLFSVNSFCILSNKENWNAKDGEEEEK